MIGVNATVRFESILTPGRWFTGRVTLVHEDRAIVKDPNGKWRPQVITLSRLEYVPPTLRMRK